MPGTVVPYERFLEIRQRRTRVVTELARRPGSFANEVSRDGEPLTIDCEALIDKHCGTDADSRRVAPEEPVGLTASEARRLHSAQGVLKRKQDS